MSAFLRSLGLDVRDTPIIDARHYSNTRRECNLHYCSNVIASDAHWRTKYCSEHFSNTICSNASSRPHLRYKIQAYNKGELICEDCKINLKDIYPDRTLEELATLVDVDHINSDIKHTLEGEHPVNYRLLCKNCHALKTLDNGDFIPKDCRLK